MEQKTFTPFGAKFSDRARCFGFIEALSGNAPFWYDVLQIHGTYGVPFDLIHQKLKSVNRLDYANADGTLGQLTDVEFIEFMQMTRYGAAVHGIGLGGS